MSEEKRKPNIVEAPTIFIGVGGTGSKIVKKVYDLCIPEERENISFVCMDTNVNDLKDLRGGAKDIVTIQTSSTQTVGSYLDSDEDASKHWFPKNAVIYDKTVSEGAGQLRAISRLALNSTIKTGKIAPLYNAIDSLFKKNGQEMKQALRICIASTASGGTGSGMILPFCMFIRDYVNNKYPNAAVILRTLILLPETLDSVIKSSIERDSQRRNAYATIKEFNAFMMKGSGFCDIEQVLKRYSDLHIDITDSGRNELKKLSVLPCDFCFLLDGQDAEDATSNSFEQYKNQAALALYEQNIGPMQKKAFSVEDNIIKELSNPGNYGRNRFGGIGAGRIVYPYEDIADYIAYDWAKSSIGGNAEASKWTYYDEETRRKQIEDEKAGRSVDESISVEDGYIQALKKDESAFSRSIKQHYHLEDDGADNKIQLFLDAFRDSINDEVGKNKKIESMVNNLARLRGAAPYEDPSFWANAGNDYSSLVSYAGAVRDLVNRIAKNAAEGILRNKEKTLNQKDKANHLESLMSVGNYMCHPCAARYMLYMAKNKAKELFDEADSECSSLAEKINKHQRDYDTPVVIKNGRNSVSLVNLKDFCNYVSGLNSDSKSDKKIVDKYSEYLNRMHTFYADVEKYKTFCAEKVALGELVSYLDEINKQFKRFFDKFADNVKSIETKQQDLIDALKYKKGDSIRYICSDKDVLDSLSFSTNTSMEKNQLLDDELNAAIFDQVKINAQLSHDYERSNGIIEKDERCDIFNEILMNYFFAKVRSSCPEIDMNIIDAIIREKRLKDVIKARSEGAESVPQNDPKAIKGYLQEVLNNGEKLSAPGIQRMVSEESREVNVCAYNSSLKYMRGDYRVDDLIPNGEGVDTVSKYELHYFNALYNLTPDKLKKFSAPRVTETGIRPAGLYHNAYTVYTRDIGPDCLKSSKMTTHIDRRWDSIAAMPELDMDYQQRQFINTHKALIYGLVFNRISREAYKDGNADIKNPAMVYRYHNTKGFIEDMVVTNGTLCDEFYEILDSLYIDRKLVADIYDYEKHKTAKDIMSRVEYKQTEFCKAVHALKLFYNNDVIENASALLIPLLYSNSLPSRLADDAEIACLIDAVIEIFSVQIKKYESEKNAKFILCEELEAQFDKFKENYKLELVNGGIGINDNKVVDIMKRKLREVYESSPQPENYEEIIDNLEKEI